MSKIVKLILAAKRNMQEIGIKDTIFKIGRYMRVRIKKSIKRKADYLELKNPLGEKKYVTMKPSPVVYIVAGIPYYDIGCGQRCAQLAKTFNKMGYCVNFLYGTGSLDSIKKDLVMPVSMHTVINSNSIQYVRERVKKDDLFIFEAPSPKFEKLIDIAVENDCKIVYENIDNWETSLGSQVFDENILVKLLASAHLLVGTSKPLVEQLEQYLVKYHISKQDKKILYLANAVDDELFCGAKSCDRPEDLVSGECTLLYYGSLWGEWFMWDLLIGLAKRHPEYAINLIGNIDGIDKKVKMCPENIHFLGLKEQKELPAYLQYIDYAILPFECGKIGDYVSPLKIFEYIAMYSKVISTPLPDIIGYPNVYCGESVEEWEEIILADYKVDKEAADSFVDENTWFYRATSIVDALYQKKESLLKDKLSIVILNYNNANVIFKCINSLLKYKELYGYKIIVVDNGSSDGSYEQLQERYSSDEILLCRNEKNGCSSGRNLGVSYVDTEYIMYLDSDQWIAHKYWLKPYEQIMDIYKEFGCIGWSAGFFYPSGGAGNTSEKLPHYGLLPNVLCSSNVGYVGTGGMLMRLADFGEVGGFDTNYDPTGYEDTDLALKIRNLGKEIYYCRYLGVIHLPHQTTSDIFSEHEKLLNQNREYFIEKWKKQNPKLLKYIK